MTWLKLGDDFADQCASLSDAAFRTHVEGLIWAMRRENGGHLDDRAVRRAIETAHPDLAVAELVDAGLWAESDGGWQIVHAMDDQPEPDVIAARRSMATERQRRKRMKAAGLSRRDDPRDDPRYPGRVGTGRDGVPSDVGTGTSNSVANSQNRRVHNGSEKPTTDVQHFPQPVPSQSPATDRNARETRNDERKITGHLKAVP